MTARLYLRFAVCLAAIPVFGADETLRYSIHWPTGLSLGEATHGVSENGRRSTFKLDASFPGVPVVGEFTSVADPRGCTTLFHKEYTFGLKKTSETITVSNGQAARATDAGGGTSTLRVGDCSRDALAYMKFLRTELKAGRRPGPQQILFGALYEVRLVYKGTAKVKSGDQLIETDHFEFHVKGPASETNFEANFARDSARTPVKFVVPTSLGTFTMDLIRQPE